LATIAARVERTRLHQLSDILTIAILSVIAGGLGRYGSVWTEQRTWLSTFLALPNGIPSAAFRRVLEQLMPNSLLSALSNG